MVTPAGLVPANVQSVGIIGLGLIGGSLALALRDAGLDVIVWDTDAETREQASADGLAVGADVTVPAGADLVFVAVPLRAAAATFEAIAESVRPDAVVSDVGSVKAEVHRAAEVAGLADRFVGAHPMAGTEHVGYRHAEAYLLTRVRWAVTVSDHVSAQAMLTVLEVLTARVEAQIVITTPERHDEVVAKISHVPHLLAGTLVHVASEAGAGPAALQLAAGSFRDGTRVVSSSSDRSAAMVWANAQGTATALDSVITQLTQVREWLTKRGEGDDLDAREHLDDWFSQAVAVRGEWGRVPATAGVPTALHIDWSASDWHDALCTETQGRIVTAVTPAGTLTTTN